jgi:hypothetical protein
LAEAANILVANAAFANDQRGITLVSNNALNVGADANNHRIIDIVELINSAIPSARRKFQSEAMGQRDSPAL